MTSITQAVEARPKLRASVRRVAPKVWVIVLALLDYWTGRNAVEWLADAFNTSQVVVMAAGFAVVDQALYEIGRRMPKRWVERILLFIPGDPSYPGAIETTAREVTVAPSGPIDPVDAAQLWGDGGVPEPADDPADPDSGWAAALDEAARRHGTES